MSIKTNIALSLAIVMGTASVALAAPRHPVRHHQASVVHQVPRSAYQSYGSARGAPRPEYRGFGASGGLNYNPYDKDAIRCIGGSCAPAWVTDY